MQVARYEDYIHQVEDDHDSLRREVRFLASKVRELEKGRDYHEIRILRTYYHLEETHSLVQYQQIMIESLE